MGEATLRSKKETLLLLLLLNKSILTRNKVSAVAVA